LRRLWLCRGAMPEDRGFFHLPGVSQARQGKSAKEANKQSMKVDKMAFTGRELQILELLAQGKRNKQIATELGTREQTVKNQFHRVFLKLGVTNRTQAAVKAIKERLIELPQ